MRHPFLRLLDGLLYSSAWLALAAAAQTAATLRRLPGGFGAVGWQTVGLVGAATLLAYNLDAVLPYKFGQPAGASARKAWQHHHRRALAVLALGAGLLALGLGLQGHWLREWARLLPLLALALGYSLPLLPWHGRRRAIREVPLLKGFLIAGVWTVVTVGLPALALHQPLGPLAGLAGQRFLLVAALTVVFDLRDLGRDRAAGLRTLPVVLGPGGARALALGLLAGSGALGLGRGAPPLAVLGPGALAAGVVALAHERRHDYYFALLADGVLLVQAAAYFL